MAASYTFKVSTDDLERGAKAFDNSRNKCVQIARKIMAVGDELQGTWEGDDATTFFNKLKGIEGDINDISKIINEHVLDLRKAAQEFKAGMDTSKAKASGLQSDVISY